MKIVEKKRFWKSALAIIVLFVSAVVFLFFVTIRNAPGIPMLSGEEASLIPPVITTYSISQCADFQMSGVQKKVCAYAGSEVPGDEEDKKAFEDNFHLMMVFAEEDIPFTSWLTVTYLESPSRISIQLSDGYSIYAAGGGETFATAMDSLITGFFLYDHMEEKEGLEAKIQKRDIEI